MRICYKSIQKSMQMSTCQISFSNTGFVPVRLSNGMSIVKGQTITSFTNSEEAAGNFFNVVPFLLETKLRSLGANFVAGPIFKPNVQVDDIFFFFYKILNHFSSSCANKNALHL